MEISKSQAFIMNVREEKADVVSRKLNDPDRAHR